MHNQAEATSLQILLECEDIDLIEDLLSGNEELEQFFINL